MVHRKSYPVGNDCEIALTTERLADGWAVVVSLKHDTPGAERVVDLPVSSARFDTEDKAEFAAEGGAGQVDVPSAGANVTTAPA